MRQCELQWHSTTKISLTHIWSTIRCCPSSFYVMLICQRVFRIHKFKISIPDQQTLLKTVFICVNNSIIDSSHRITISNKYASQSRGIMKRYVGWRKIRIGEWLSTAGPMEQFQLFWSGLPRLSTTLRSTSGSLESGTIFMGNKTPPRSMISGRAEGYDSIIQAIRRVQLNTSASWFKDRKLSIYSFRVAPSATPL